MSRYSRMVLHFMHAITNDRDRVFTFLFGTRLTNVTRALRHRDVDVALDAGGQDGRGLVRRHAHRPLPGRVQRHGRAGCLGQGAVVLLITDGLDRDAGEGLDGGDGAAAQILPPPDLAQPALALRRLRAKIQGAQAIMPHVDDFRPVHNLESLADLGAALAPPGRAGEWKE